MLRTSTQRLAAEPSGVADGRPGWERGIDLGKDAAMLDETSQVNRSALFDQLTELVEGEVLPGAVDVDRSGAFPAANIAALAELGLFGMVVPTSLGGLGLTAAEARAALRLLSSGCGATAFAFAQHHGATGAVAATRNDTISEHWLPKLLTTTLAGTAFAHVRRPGRPVLRAVADEEGWVLSGTAPWVTSWGHAEVMTVAATTDDGQLVWALLPARETPGLHVDKVFGLMVFNATNTVALRFESLRIEPEQVLSVIDFGRWAARDRALSARPSPLCLGIGDRALAELRVAAPVVAASLDPWWTEHVNAAEAQCVRVDQAIADRTIEASAANDALVEQTAAARTSALLAVQRLTTTLLAASGGGAIEDSHIAQRLSREALFFVIQAQSPDGKAATLGRLTLD